MYNNTFNATPSQQSSVRYAVIDFKYESLTFLAPFKISVGDWVVVEGDRGEHIGRVADITAEKPSYPVPCKVLRRAGSKDRVQFDDKNAKELISTKLCQDLAASMGLQIAVIDTELQFDCNKLTVYFASKHHHIDFRKYQRTLFREYRCRIWLTNMAEVQQEKAMARSR